MHFVGIIQQWFDEFIGGTLLLPDGWYGRPYDNQHALTHIEQYGSRLAIELDHRLRLQFECVESVEVKGSELVIGPFKKLKFEAEGHGAAKVIRATEYSDGQVRIVASGVR
jgi:hypothetical protein